MPKEYITINGCQYKLLFTRGQILMKVRQIAEQIADDYKTAGIKESPLLMSVLTGGMYLTVDLSRALSDIGFETSVDIVGLKRFTQDEKGGIVQMNAFPRAKLSGRDIIVVEDIIDQGLTMNFFHRYLLNLDEPPRSIEYCTLLLKTNHEPLDFSVKYLGWEVGSDWVIGNGMDGEQHYRGLKDIYVKI